MYSSLLMFPRVLLDILKWKQPLKSRYLSPVRFSKVLGTCCNAKQCARSMCCRFDRFPKESGSLFNFTENDRSRWRRFVRFPMESGRDLTPENGICKCFNESRLKISSGNFSRVQPIDITIRSRCFNSAMDFGIRPASPSNSNSRNCKGACDSSCYNAGKLGRLSCTSKTLNFVNGIKEGR